MSIHAIIDYALQQNASDIILTGESYPCIKVHGEIQKLTEYEYISKETSKKIFEAITNEQQKKLFEAQKELDFALEIASLGRFRVNVFLQREGYGIVFRPIKTEIPAFEALGIPAILKKIIQKHHGLILITGSVGSGKSTTMASLIQEINTTQKKHIITLEDPIEFIFEDNLSVIEQREVGKHTESFENGIKYALREACDVIMIGEMRDLETFRLALRAAETGCLVLTTLHTSGASRAVARIVDMFPGNEKNIVKQQLAESLLAVVWQKLLKNATYTGRVLASEVLINTVSVSNLIRKDQTHQIPNAIETGKEFGMQSMKSCLDTLLAENKINRQTYEQEIEQLDRYF